MLNIFGNYSFKKSFSKRLREPGHKIHFLQPVSWSHSHSHTTTRTSPRPLHGILPPRFLHKLYYSYRYLTVTVSVVVSHSYQESTVTLSCEQLINNNMAGAQRRLTCCVVLTFLRSHILVNTYLLHKVYFRHYFIWAREGLPFPCGYEIICIISTIPWINLRARNKETHLSKFHKHLY